jgi:Arc/MetJ-type ribon-helix-helix transcriptional regulator
MMISLPPELEAFSHQQIELGKYTSIEEILVDGMWALIDREAIEQARMEELRQELQIGVDALARGESQDLDTAIDALRQKMRDRDRLLA